MESLLAYESDEDISEANDVRSSGSSKSHAEDDAFLSDENWNTPGSKEEERPEGKGDGSLCLGMSSTMQLTSSQVEKQEQEEQRRAKMTTLGDVREEPAKARLPRPFSTDVACSLSNPILVPSLKKPTAKRKERTGDGEKTKERTNRIRTFPHVEGNFAVHVYIPVAIPQGLRESLGKVLEISSRALTGLQPMAEDVVDTMAVVSQDPVQSSSGIASSIFVVPAECHISLSRTTAVRFEQIDLLVSALRRKLRGQKTFPIQFSRWECFVNDERMRSFLSLEVLALGLPEIKRQTKLVDEAFFLHQLPLFYDPPRPHISLAWLLGDREAQLQSVADDLNEAGGLGRVADGKKVEGAKPVIQSKFGKVVCKIGQREYVVCDAFVTPR